MPEGYGATKGKAPKSAKTDSHVPVKPRAIELPLTSHILPRKQRDKQYRQLIKQALERKKSNAKIARSNQRASDITSNGNIPRQSVVEAGDRKTATATDAYGIASANRPGSAKHQAEEQVPSTRKSCPHCSKSFPRKSYSRHIRACQRAAETNIVRCSMCGLAFQALALPAHMTRSHGKTFGTPGNLPIIVEKLSDPTNKVIPETLVECKQCNAKVYPWAMQRHIQTCHTTEEEWAPKGAAGKFSFVLLPPSTGSLRATIEQYRAFSRTGPLSLTGAVFDWERLDRIEGMTPTARYVGVKSWKGYVVFEFQRSSGVILECPRTGNATYVLYGKWREMICATKAELRSEFRHLCTRIIHTAEWEKRVRRALFGSERAAVIAQRENVGRKR